MTNHTLSLTSISETFGRLNRRIVKKSFLSSIVTLANEYRFKEPNMPYTLHLCHRAYSGYLVIV